MKLYTDKQQTTKLIELGFEKPKSIGGYEPTFIVEYEGVEVSNVIIGENRQCPIYAYSIGELIEMLPNVVESEDSEYATLQMYFDLFNWIIEYIGVNKAEYATSAIELIDALYDMCVKLKEEGVI